MSPTLISPVSRTSASIWRSSVPSESMTASDKRLDPCNLNFGISIFASIGDFGMVSNNVRGWVSRCPEAQSFRSSVDEHFGGNILLKKKHLEKSLLLRQIFKCGTYHIFAI